MFDESKLSSYLFFVEIDGIETARFQICEGLEAETVSFEYEEGGGEVHHFQGRTRYPVMKRLKKLLTKRLESMWTCIRRKIFLTENQNDKKIDFSSELMCIKKYKSSI